MSEAELDAHTPHSPRRVLKGFLGILTGSAIAQLLAVAAIPVLSRLYTPADTAHYAQLLGIGAVLASFAGLRLDLAIPIPERTEESRALFWIAALSPFVVLPVTGIVVGALHLAGVWRADSLDLVDYLAVAAFVVVLSLFAAAGQLAIRLRAYTVLSRIPVVQMTGTLIAQIAFGLVGFGRGLFIGGLIGRSLGIAGLMRSCDVRVAQAPGRQETVHLLKKYWRFPLIFAPSSIIETLGWNLAAVMLPSLFGFGPAGLYAMAARVAGVPGTVLSQSAGQVFTGEFARTTTRQASLRVFFRWSVALGLMGLAVAVGIWIAAPLILPWLLGSEWTGTALLAQYTGVMAGAQIFASPFHHVWEVRQRGFMLFSWNVLRLGATAAVIWFGAKSGEPLSVVVFYLMLVTAAVYGVSWLGCLWAAARAPANAGTAGTAP
ncbi:MAG: oligosaccharide flippase family protein [Candidatus Nanopelagicales bacterium]